jgi:serine phosphatase RsbU (regulator of sigma subunit)
MPRASDNVRRSALRAGGAAAHALRSPPRRVAARRAEERSINLQSFLARRRWRRAARLRRGMRVSRPLVAPLTALVVGLVITGILSWLAYLANDRNESRLLRSQVRQTGALLQAITPTIQTPLASAVEIAASGTAGTSRFTSYLSSFIGTGKPFVSAELWDVAGPRPRVLATVGGRPALNASSAAAARLAAAAQRRGKLELLGPLGADPARLGYAFASTGTGPSYLVYAESVLPPHRRAVVPKNSPFGNLRFALYLGDTRSPARLLETNVAKLPVHGRTAAIKVPFGGSAFTLVAGSSRQLGGTVAGSLWWIIALAGTAFTAAAALTAQRLVTGRQDAERFSREVRKLLAEQRTIAEALQHALLPKQLPHIPAMEITARYVPGTDGVQIGGDWYDVSPLEGDRVFFVVGDVSGRGLEAGSVMAALLFASRGFASEGHQPDGVLNALARLLDVNGDEHFATVLCGILDVGQHTLALANAGHLPPLLVSPERTEFIAVPTGPPIGVPQSDGYAAITVPIPRDATLLAYTDGLIERRGETLDDGLRRLFAAATEAGLTGEALVEDIMKALLPDGCDDDTAVLGLRWRQ